MPSAQSTLGAKARSRTIGDVREDEPQEVRDGVWRPRQNEEHNNHKGDQQRADMRAHLRRLPRAPLRRAAQYGSLALSRPSDGRRLRCGAGGGALDALFVTVVLQLKHLNVVAELIARV